jgi:hypothetical protein
MENGKWKMGKEPALIIYICKRERNQAQSKLQTSVRAQGPSVFSPLPASRIIINLRHQSSSSIAIFILIFMFISILTHIHEQGKSTSK